MWTAFTAMALATPASVSLDVDWERYLARHDMTWDWKLVPDDQVWSLRPDVPSSLHACADSSDGGSFGR